MLSRQDRLERLATLFQALDVVMDEAIDLLHRMGDNFKEIADELEEGKPEHGFADLLNGDKT